MNKLNTKLRWNLPLNFENCGYYVSKIISGNII